MVLGEFVIKCFVQAGIGLLLATVLWGGHRLVARLLGRERQPWRTWLGLTAPVSVTLGLSFAVGFAGLGFVLPYLLLGTAPDYDGVVRASPQFEIAAQPAVTMLVAAAAYGLIMTGFTEELLFRGLIAKRLIHWLGNTIGNLAQALIFAALHIVIVLVAVDDPGVPLLLIGGALPGLMGWIFGWAMIRDDGSIFAPWLAHAAVNFATVLAYVAIF